MCNSTYGKVLLPVFLLVIWPAITVPATTHIRINIPSCTLTVFDDNRKLAEYPVRVGSPVNPTPRGKGRIVEKRDRIVFRYLEGEQKGEIIRRSNIDPTGETIDMPYDRLRGLAVQLDNGQELVIHSTTEYWTIGFPVSHMCIGLEIDDMLKLFDLVPETMCDIDITYDTVDLVGDVIRFYPDFYGYETNRETRVIALGIPVKDHASARNRINMIDQDLRYRLKEVLRRLREGKDVRSMRSLLVHTVSVAEFLKPFHPRGRVIAVRVEDGDSFAAPLIRSGISAKLAVAIGNAVKGLDHCRLQPGDEFILVVEEKEVINFEYIGGQGTKNFQLRGANLFVDQPR